MPRVQTKYFSCEVCNKIVINVLWYSDSIARNKLLITSTNPTGNNLTAWKCVLTDVVHFK